MWSIFARRLWRDERGATAIEYGLIIAVVVIAMMSAIGSLGETVGEMWTIVADNYLSVT